MSFPNFDFEAPPPFTAAQTADNWIDGTAAGSGSNNLYGWWASPRATAIAVQFDNAQFHSGAWSLKVSTTNTTGRARVFTAKASAGSVTGNNTQIPFLIPAKPGGTYTFTGWAKTTNVAASGAFIEIVEMSNAFAVGTSTGSSALTGTNGWTQLTATVTVGATTNWLVVDVQNATAGNVSDAWFDDLSLTGPGLPYGFYIPIRPANRNVGSMAQRQNFRQPIPWSTQITGGNVFTSSLSGGLSFTGASGPTATRKAVSGGLSFVGGITKRTARPLSAFLRFTASGGIACIHTGSYSQNSTSLIQTDTDAAVAAVVAAIPNCTHIAIGTFFDFDSTSINDQFAKWATSIHTAGKKLYVRSSGFNDWQGSWGALQYTSADFAQNHRTKLITWLGNNYANLLPGDVFEPVPDEPENNSMWNSTYGTIGSGAGQAAFNAFIVGSITDAKTKLQQLGVPGIQVEVVHTSPSTAASVITDETTGYLLYTGSQHYPENGLSTPADMATAMSSEITTYVANAHGNKPAHITYGPSIYSQMTEANQADALTQEFNAISAALGSRLRGITIWQLGDHANSPLSRVFEWSGSAWTARQGAASINTFFPQLLIDGLLKRAGKPLAGVLSFSGVIPFRAIRKALTGGLSFTGTIPARAITHHMTAALSFTGALTKRTFRALTGVLSFTGAFASGSIHLISLTAALSFTGAMTKRTNKVMTGGLSFVGAITRAVTHGLTAALSFTGNITKSTTHGAFTAALSFTGAVTKRTGHPLTGALSFTGGLIKRTAHALTGTLSFTGSVTKSTARAITAALSFTGSITKRTAHGLTAVLDFAGSLATNLIHGGGTLFTKSLTGGLSFTGSQVKRTNKVMTATLSFTGAIVSLFTAALRAWRKESQPGNVTFTKDADPESGAAWNKDPESESTTNWE